MMNDPFKAYYQSEIGLIEISGTEAGLKSLNFVDEKSVDDVIVHPALEECLAQIDQYFQGTRQEFSLQLAPEGTDFQQQVWRELSKIPYGQTASYLDVARAIGNERAVRAVGAANGQNPISIIIPCHRVIGSDGKLTGYGGGLWRKEWLLTHERNFSVGRQLTFL
jgi:methylated-DNA-[protein]-cysteine S-methyltransferase